MPEQLESIASTGHEAHKRTLASSRFLPNSDLCQRWAELASQAARKRSCVNERMVPAR